MFQTVYTPPNVAKGGCHIFDAGTGKSSHVRQCGYYSEYGRRLKDCASEDDESTEASLA